MTLGSVCHNSPSGQERLSEAYSVGRAGLGFSVVRWAGDTGHSRKMECSIGSSRTASGAPSWCIWHGPCPCLWDEDVSLVKVAGHQLLKPVLILSLLHVARFRQHSFFINLSDSDCNSFHMTYSN